MVKLVSGMYREPQNHIQVCECGYKSPDQIQDKNTVERGNI